MFEDSLFASGVTVETRRSARRTRLLALASVGLQGLVLAVFIAVPMIWPEKLPLVSVAPKMASLSLKKPEVKVEPKPVVVTTNDARMSAPSAPQVEHTTGGVIHQGPAITEAAENISLYTGSPMGSGTASLANVIGGGGGPGPSVVAATPKKEGPLNVSSGVIAGLLLAPIRPVYPPIARAAHVQGTVVVTAIINKEGRIVGLQVLSGPVMLQTAAVDAVKEARYRPFLLNGQPTDVTTTISVNFTMGG
jgi:periplasmic protein TonB